MSAKNINDQLAQQWYDVVKTLAGGDDTVGSTRMVFPCVDGSKAPLGGRGIPQALTNGYFHKFGDALLTQNNKWYTPSSNRSYFGELNTYFQHISLKKDESPAAQDAFDRAKEYETKAVRQLNALRNEVQKEWKDSQSFVKSDYNTYLVNNRPDLLAAKNEAQQATAKVASLSSAKSDPDAPEVDKVKNRCRLLADNEQLKGYSFRACTDDEDFDMQDYILAIQRGDSIQKPSEPSNTINLPQYVYSSTYKTDIEELYKSYNDTKNQYENDITASASKTSDSSSTHSKDSNGTEVGVFNWLQIKNNEHEDWSESNSISSDTNLKIHVAIKRTLIVDVSPGQWDVPGYRRKFPRVDATAPISPDKVVKPVGMLIGSGLKYTVELDSKTREAFNREYNKVKENGGRLSIFGIDIGFGGSSKEKDHNETHTTKFEPGSGVLTVEPKRDLGTAIMLAMIGEKMD